MKDKIEKLEKENQNLKENEIKNMNVKIEKLEEEIKNLKENEIKNI